MLTKQLSKTTKANLSKVTVNQPWRYSEVLSMSLLLYAQQDKDFAKKFQELTGKLSDQKGAKVLPQISGSALMLIPVDADQALSRAEWLIGRIIENSLPGSDAAANLLTAWANDKTLENPKQIVVGIVGLAIPGITLGIIKKSKTMTFIIRHDLVQKINLDLAGKITEASHGVLARALEMAQGNIDKLEPDMADWFFGERARLFYQADNEKLTKIKEELINLDIIHSGIEENGETAVLAVTPAASSTYQERYWELERLAV